MKSFTSSRIIALAALALLLIVSTASAQSGGNTSISDNAGYDLSWWTVDSGGTTSTAGSGYTLGSTAGQPDAAIWSGGNYTLSGGFWGSLAVEFHIYLPLVLRNV